MKVTVDAPTSGRFGPEVCRYEPINSVVVWLCNAAIDFEEVPAELFEKDDDWWYAAARPYAVLEA